MIVLPIAVVLILGAVGWVFLAASPLPFPQRSYMQMEAVAWNYMQYRNAVVEYVQRHPGAQGAVGPRALVADGELPSSYREIEPWQSNITGSQVAIWGPIPQQGVEFLARSLDAPSFACRSANPPSACATLPPQPMAGLWVPPPTVGINLNGFWWSPDYGYLGLPAPAFVPNGDTLSIVNVE